MTYPTIDLAQASLSTLLGLSLTLLLLFMIEQLSAMHSTNDNLKEVLVIDLTEWKAQPRTNVLKPTIKPHKPVIKKKQKTINNELAEKTLKDNKSAPPPEPAVNTQLSRVTEKDWSDDQLPVAVPFFKLTEIPRFLHQEMPEYPETMRSLGKTGRVILSVLIDKTGRVRSITVLESNGEEFDQAAIKAIMASSFIPARIDGNPVAVRLKLPITFKLL